MPMTRRSSVARFTTERHFFRHLKRMRGLYAERCEAALATVFGDRFRVELQAGGMHLLARPSSDIADVELVALAEARGLPSRPNGGDSAQRAHASALPQ
jgi:GntR family transcriptional regulator/MocR family aminotransferase